MWKAMFLAMFGASGFVLSGVFYGLGWFWPCVLSGLFGVVMWWTYNNRVVTRFVQKRRTSRYRRVKT